MTNGLRIDPIPAFNFLVGLYQSPPKKNRGKQLSQTNRSSRLNQGRMSASAAINVVAGFSECSGLESTLEIAEYQEGGANDRVHKFPSRFTFTNITLKQGITLNPPILRLWHLDLLQGKTQRRDGVIILQNEQRLPVLAWKFERGLPVKWTGPTLNANQSEVSIETLEISYEKLEPFDVGRLTSFGLERLQSVVL